MSHTIENLRGKWGIRMDNDSLHIGPERTITVPMSVLIHFLITAALVIGGYFSVRAELADATKQGTQNEQHLETVIDRLAAMEKTQVESNTTLRMFMEQYDKDMKMYIREPGRR